jgi:hypothetical protein
MTDRAAISTRRQPMLIRDVLMILLTLALFVFALQPREQAHGGRRREADAVAGVEAVSVSKHWQRGETEALGNAVVRPAFGASL